MAAAQTASMEENPFKKVVVLEPKKPVEKPAPASVRKTGYPVPGLGDSKPMKDVAPVKPAPYHEIDLSKLRIGTIVINKKYGEGKITGFKPDKVLVSFPTELKTFVIPMAFEKGFLKVKEW